MAKVTLSDIKLEDETIFVPKPKKKKKLKPSDRRHKLRERLWPGSSPEIWHRLENDGYATIPKLLSLVCTLIKANVKNDPTRVYLDLWCRCYDEGIIERINEDEAAFASGYGGKRAGRSWRDHMRSLEQLGFIKIAEDGNSEIGHVMVVNPLIAVDRLRSKTNPRKNKKPYVSTEWWNHYLARASAIGAVLPSDEVEEEAE